YVEWQGGNLLRFRKSTREVRDIKPYPGKDEAKLRFNWNTPIHVSPTRRGTLYVGAQVLFRSADRGESWQRLSPDLTTNDPAKQRQHESGGLSLDNSTAENHTTIYTISESPRNADVIWVGTDDGNVQLTRDGGKSWTNVGGATGVPRNTWVSHVEASPHAEGTAFVTLDGHATGDRKTYVYRTTDFGRTWESLATPQLEGYAHVVKQDPVNPGLLYLGTELGLFLTLDGGRQWARFTGGLPARVSVRDLAIHAREHDLIIATHGRGVYILDDLTPLRQLTPEVLDADVALLPSRPGIMALSGTLQEWTGDDEFVGQNPPEAAGIFFYQKRRHLFGDLKVEVYDAGGKLVSTIPAGKQAGINRVDWPMRLPPPRVPPASSLIPPAPGPRVPEGTYTFKLIKGSVTLPGQVVLAADPRSDHPAEDRQLQQRTALELYRLLEQLAYGVDAANDLRDQARKLAEQMGARSGLGRRLSAYADALEAFRRGLVATSEAGFLSGDEKLREQLGNLYGAVSGYEGRPTSSQLQRKLVLEAGVQDATRRLAALTAQLEALNAQLGGRWQPLRLLGREEWAKR
ncbi:MAG: glycosyl hydrolase, partial [Gemmatimonadetes bacterium]|nr:glycosyl hydrolase [Gemmatimonadota bacterium]